MKEFILVHDLGTTADKACLFDRRGRLLASRLHPLSVFYPGRNRAEQRPSEWWSALCTGTRELLAESGHDAESIACISLCGHNPSTVFVDESGTPIFDSVPIYADLRATETADQAIARLGGFDAYYLLTGAGQIPAQYSCFKAAWLLREHSKLRMSAAAVLNTMDYLAYRLTGNMATDFSSASNTGFMDIRNRAWSEAVLDALDMPARLLPRIVPSTMPVGEVTAEAEKAAGLAAGTPVFIAGGDVLCSAAAAVSKPGDFYINLGSAAWIGTLSPAPVLNPETRLVNYCHIDPKYYAPHHAMTGAGIDLQWLRDRLYPDIRQKTDDRYERMTEDAATIPPGSDGLVFLPYMRGIYAGEPESDARGVYFGLDLGHGNGHLVRAIMEGVAMAMRELCGMMRRDGLDPTSLRLMGGGSRSRLWRQIFADVCGIPVSATILRQEASSFGAAMAASVGMGMTPSFEEAETLNPVEEICEPDPAAMRVYEDAYGVFSDLAEIGRPLFRKLR